MDLFGPIRKIPSSIVSIDSCVDAADPIIGRVKGRKHHDD